MARDKPTDPQPRGKGKDGRSLTSNVTPTPYLQHHPYAKITRIRPVTTANVRTGHLENTRSEPVALHRTTLSLRVYTSAKTERNKNKKPDKNLNWKF